MKRWFKILGSLVGAALLATMVVGAVFAQGPVEDSDGVRDLDGDGLGLGRGASYGFVDEDGDGVNDQYLSDHEFVDQDGDGICDVCGGLPGEGYNQENGYARGNGYGFVDEDGDGICDTHGVAVGQGSGPQFRTERETEQTPMARRGGFARRAAAQ